MGFLTTLSEAFGVLHRVTMVVVALWAAVTIVQRLRTGKLMLAFYCIIGMGFAVLFAWTGPGDPGDVTNVVWIVGVAVIWLIMAREFRKSRVRSGPAADISVLLLIAGVGAAFTAVPANGQDPRLIPLTISETVKVDMDFGMVISASFGNSGDHVAFLDAMAPSITVLTVHGDHLATWGRRGEGPGEMKSPAAVAMIDGHELLAVADPGNASVNVYSYEGEFLNSYRTPSDGLVIGLGMARDGVPIVLTRDVSPSSRRSRGVRLDSLKTVIWHRDEDYGAVRRFQDEPAVVMAMLSNGQAVFGIGNTYELDVVDTQTGKLVGEISRLVAQRGEGDLFQAVLDGPGGIWVMRGVGLDDGVAPVLSEEGDELFPRQLWDVFDRNDFQYRGTVDLDNDRFLPAMGLPDGRLVGIEFDADFVQHAKVVTVDFLSGGL